MQYLCNSCADTENGVAPCFYDVPDCLGSPPVNYCPVSGEGADWQIAEVVSTSEQGEQASTSPNIESVPPGEARIWG